MRENAILSWPFPPDLREIYTPEFAVLLADTASAISALDQMTRSLQNPYLLMNPLVEKEAETSSRLEGTQVSIDDIYKIDLNELSAEKRDQTIEVQNYKRALLNGDVLINKYGFSELLIREVHKTLTSGPWSNETTPGKYRRENVHIGRPGSSRKEADYLPPQFTHIKPLMEEFTKYANQDSAALHPLIICGVLHHRIEAIHPFRDGNGRTGRTLISLFLIYKQLLKYPTLYPSGYFERHRDNYLDSLRAVDHHQAWSEWLTFFLTALRSQAKIAHEAGQSILARFDEAKHKLEKERVSLDAMRTLEHTFKRPYITRSMLRNDLNIPIASGRRYLELLANQKTLTRVGISKSREAVYANFPLLLILRKI